MNNQEEGKTGTTKSENVNEQKYSSIARENTRHALCAELAMGFLSSLRETIIKGVEN